ncbi:hypothetical protein [Paractinoplanes rishiriensis]|uniref:hypothetical protein n=1 Tax=Paractinoplanes rishiriensis TaxID=1050105 RepID=UPI0019421060|nr:hypothetical protein [Actinoplanes rishiriensis]
MTGAWICELTAWVNERTAWGADRQPVVTRLARQGSLAHPLPAARSGRMACS